VFGGFLLRRPRGRSGGPQARLFLVGLALFTLASMLNGIAQSSGMLIIGRGLQGLGGALVSPAALSIVTTTFSEGAQRTKALGVWSAIAAAGTAAGLLVAPNARLVGVWGTVASLRGQ
jgi:MFS family permease